jgi:hypothetical protein
LVAPPNPVCGTVKYRVADPCGVALSSPTSCRQKYGFEDIGVGVPPLSSKSTELALFSDNLLAITDPALPPPTVYRI